MWVIQIIFRTAGKELTVPHQMSLAGAISLPVFWLAGAGAAVFWVLGEPECRAFVTVMDDTDTCCGSAED